MIRKLFPLVLTALCALGCQRGEVNASAAKTTAGLPVLALAPFSVVENSASTFLFTLSKAIDTPVSFIWTVAGPSVGQRFSQTSGTVTIAAGATNLAVNIPLVDDGLYQGDQTFTVTLAGTPAAVQVAQSTISFTLVDDETKPRVRFSVSAQSLAEAAGPATIIATLSGPSIYATTVGFTVGGTATSGADYSLSPASSLSFAAGSTQATLTANIVDDYITEPDETVIVTLATVSAGQAVIDTGARVHTLTITNDDFAPFVTLVTSTTADGSYHTGTIPITVRFTQAVAVTGVPTLTLSTGRTVTYASGGGGTDLIFNYVIQAGDTSADLDYAGTSSLVLAGGRITGVGNGLDAQLTLATPGQSGSLGAAKNIVIDTTPPVVTRLSSTTADGAYGLGSVLSLQVTFSEVVFVTGSPTLTLETGTVDHQATFVSGGGTSTLTFTYTVLAGDTSADLDAASAAGLAGSLADFAGNAATLTLPIANATGSLSANQALVLDTTAPTVIGVSSSKANGYYTVGEVIPVLVIFSETVNVTGTPRLTLETGTIDRVADYASGSGGSTLIFNYVVQAGDTAATLDYISNSALALNGGTIRDPALNAANLTLAAPGAAGSLASQKTITIDTVAPGNPRSVDDGTWVTSLAQSPVINWQSASDDLSGIDHYEFALGTSSGGTDVVYWVTNAAALTRLETALSLTEGTRYYASVRAVDRAGNISGVASGDGFRADVTAPTVPASLDDGLTSSSTTQSPALSWAAATDALSGLSTYQIAIGTSAGAIDQMDWTDVGTGLSATLSALSLTEGATYYASVRARDVAGNSGAARGGDGWVIGWLQQAYLKGSVTSANASAGGAVAISGNTMVVGAPGGQGAAFVYVRNGTTWTEQARLTASNGESGDQFGLSVAIDGDTIAVGAPMEDNYSFSISGSAPSGLGSNNLASNSGAAYIFVRAGTTWSLQAFAKASNADSNDQYGNAVAVSGDTVVIGAIGESSNQTGASTSASNNNSLSGAGAAYVLKRGGTTWSQAAYLKASAVQGSAKFGQSVAASLDTVAVGAPGDAGGLATVFRYVSSTWTTEATIRAVNTDAGDLFGTSVAISGDTLVVGAPGESSDQRGITNGGTASSSNAASNAGAAYAYLRTGASWSQQAYLKAANADGGDRFGYAVAIDGNLVLVGAPYEASAQRTVGQIAQTSSSNGAANAGAAYLYRRATATWSELAYLKAPNADAGDVFGSAVGVAGESLAVGAAYEGSSQTGITNGASASSDNGTAQSGAAYLFQR